MSTPPLNCGNHDVPLQTNRTESLELIEKQQQKTKKRNKKDKEDHSLCRGHLPLFLQRKTKKDDLHSVIFENFIRLCQVIFRERLAIKLFFNSEKIHSVAHSTTRHVVAGSSVPYVISCVYLSVNSSDAQ